MKQLNKLKAATVDYENMANTTTDRYAALVKFDFRKRKVNSSDAVIFTSIAGDNRADAFDRFMDSDESSGMFDEDIECMVVICEDWL